MKEEILPSKYWEWLNDDISKWLNLRGYKNFKRTLNPHYFTFFLLPFLLVQSNLDGLEKVTSLKERIKALLGIFRIHEIYGFKRSLSYNFTTRLLWEYVKREFPSMCNELEEPNEGNPPILLDEGKLISADLANSILEFRSINDGLLSEPNSKVDTIAELGGGYGRTAYVFLKLQKNIKYFMIDLPLSLWIGQKYLSKVLPDKRVFKFRHFNEFGEIREELEKKDIIFLTPNQVELLPEKSIDLFLNISSLHEMRNDTIAYYFNQIDRLTKGFFYFKQWKVSTIPYENLTIKEYDYPIPREWKKIYHRDCVFPASFFEAMWKVS